jgi:hypothetical protein
VLDQPQQGGSAAHGWLAGGGLGRVGDLPDQRFPLVLQQGQQHLALASVQTRGFLSGTRPA